MNNRTGTITRALRIPLLVTTALAPFAAHAQTVPQGGTVVRGSAQIATPSANATTITQTSDRAIINWKNFSIAEGGTVDVRAPDASSVLLNRVTGDATSVIAGRLNANGQVYLVNPNGIMITKTGSVNAAGFVASTLDIGDDAFMKGGSLSFTGAGGSVANAGSITIARGGYAALLGGEVDNRGLILAPIGKVAMGAGDRATLDFGADGFLQVALSDGASATLTHSGRITAKGGAVILSAGQAREAARNTVNLGGVDAATSVARSGSNVVLGGTISATEGGRVTVSGSEVVLESATIDVTGAAGGGAVRIGGDWHGEGSLSPAASVSVDAATTIRADATAQGNGGDVVVWSDARTDFAGAISARGAGGGDGGDAEVSSKGVLDYRGTTDLTGATFGTLLLDPRNVTISTGADSGAAAFVAIADDSVINATTLTNALKTANVTVSTGTTGTQAGNITVTAPLAWATNAALTLQAAGDIAINAAVSAQAGALRIDAGGTSGGTGAITVAQFVNQAGNWRQIGAGIAGFTAADFRISGGSFMRASGGTGASGTPWQLIDIYGFQGIKDLSAASYRLVANIDAGITANWNGGSGFAQIADFSGSIDGQRYTLSGLTRTGGSQSPFATFRGTLSNINLSDVQLSGSDQGGILANYIEGATLSNVHFSGTVATTSDYVGAVAYSLRNSSVDGMSVSATVNSGFRAGGAFYTVGNSAIQNFYVNAVVNTDRTAGFSYLMDSGSSLTNGYIVAVLGGTLRFAVSSQSDGAWANLYVDTDITLANDNVDVHYTERSTGLMRGSGTYSGFDFSNVWYQGGDMRPVLRGEAAPRASDGVYEISTLKQLQLINVDNGREYRLIADIDASPTDGSNARSIWGPRGWVPLVFYDYLDGGLHTISNLTIKQGGALSTGFIGSLNGGVRNLRLVDVDISGGGTSGGLVGSLLSGNIDNVWLSGTLSLGDRGGGLVGDNQGSITNAHVSATITGSGRTGGLAGFNNGTLQQSSFNGTITASGDGTSRVGGLVGTNYGTVLNNFATGQINYSGSGYAGGLVGGFYLGSLDKNWSAITLSGSNTGGVVGYALWNVGTNYWDSGVAGVASAIYLNGGSYTDGSVALTTAQARQGYQYAALDLTSIWYQSGNMRPILRSELVSQNGVGQVFNVRQLQLIDTNLAGSYALIADIDASATQGANASGIWSTGGFMSIGDTGTSFGFAGDFDGRGHAITGFSQTATNPFANYEQGLFARAAGQIHDFSISGSIGSTARYTGVVGNLLTIGAVSGTVRNVTSNLTVSASSYWAGGIGGLVSGTIENSRFTGAITGASAGGIAGYLSAGGIVRSSAASGTVTSNGNTGGSVGGIVGYFANGEVRDVYFDGTVSNTAGRGGMLFGTLFGSSSPISGVFLNGTINASSRNGVVANNAVYASTPIIFNSDKIAASLVTSDATTAKAGYTTAQLQDRSAYGSVYANFDFANTWIVPNQSGQGGDSTAHVAQLRALNDVVIVGMAGTARRYGYDNTTFVTDYANLRAGDFITAPGTLTSVATTASNVGLYSASLSGVGAYAPSGASYRIVNMVNQLRVDPRQNYILPQAATRLYGAANPAIAYIVIGDGIVSGDSVTGNVNAAANLASNVGTYQITASTFNAGANYTFTYGTNVLTVTPRPLTILYYADAHSETYGDAIGALSGNAVATGLRNGDGLADVTSGTATFTTTAGPTSNVGGYAIVGSGLTGSSANYTYTFNQWGPNSVALTINPAAATVTYTANPASASYGDALGSLSGTTSVTGLKNGDTLSGVTGGTASFATTATPGNNVGSYAITGSGLSDASSNYTFSFVQDAGNASALAINPAPLTLIYQASPQFVAYGDTIGARTGNVATSGLKNGETLADVTSGTAVFSTTATSSSNAGNYAVTGSGLTASSSNYTYTFLQSLGNSSALHIMPRAITVTADALSRVYGDANPALTYQLTSGSLVNGDGLTGALATGATTSSNVGGYGIAQGLLTAGSNYALTFVGANLTVTKAPVTVTYTAADRTSVYGDAGVPLAGSAAVVGLKNGDSAASAVSGWPSWATAVIYASDVGSYAITGFGMSAVDGNYDVTFQQAASNATAYTITPRPITVTADALSRVYGDANPSLTYQLTSGSLANGDSLTGVLTTAATLTSNVGAYGITQGTLAATSNYTLTYAGADLTITKAPVTIAYEASFAGSNYGNAIASLDGFIVPYGLKNGDARTAAVSGTATWTTTATTASNVGSYAITGSGLSAVDGNYDVTFAQASGNATNYTILPRAITVTADALSRVYGDANPALTYQVTSGSLANGDGLSGALGTAATLTSNIGGYAITQGNLAATSNYALSFNPGTLTITKAPVTVVYGTTIQTSQYGDAIPSFGGWVDIGGIKNDESTTLAVDGSFGFSTTATSTSDVGTYAIVGSGMYAVDGNYSVTFSQAPQNAAGYIITPRELRVSAISASRVYGDANPALSYRILSGSLVNGDTLSGAPTTTATQGSNVGAYAISAAGITASSNYNLTRYDATLTVTRAPVTVTYTAADRTSLYGDPIAAPGGSAVFEGLKNGDAATTAVSGSASWTTTATSASGVGTYAVTGAGLGAVNGNYTVTFQQAGSNATAYAITPRPISVAANALARAYGDANPALGYTLTSGSLVNGDTLSGALATSATATSNVGAYGITLGTLAAGGNYTLGFTSGSLHVTRRPVTVTANAAARAYGDANPALTFSTTSLGAGEALRGLLATAATMASPVGDYAITQGTVTDASNPNYAISYVGATLHVTPLGLTVTITPNAVSRIYGDANPLRGTATADGLRNGDTLTSVALASDATRTSPVGSYALTASDAQGTGLSNYAITYVTLAGGLTVVPRVIAVAANPASRVYGDANPALGYTLTSGSLVNGDTFSGALATSATASSGVGSYGITGGTLTAGGNYALDFSGANLTITPRAITVTANPLSRIYGDANPVLTYALTSGSLVGGDSLSGALATTATAMSDIGAYRITQGSLAAGSNYVLTFNGANLTIKPRAITVTADALSRPYGEANPTLTFTVGGKGLVAGDTLRGALATDAETTSASGSYAISRGTIAAGPNYSVTFEAGVLTVLPGASAVSVFSAGALFRDHLRYRMRFDDMPKSSPLGIRGLEVLGCVATFDAFAATNVSGWVCQ